MNCYKILLGVIIALIPLNNFPQIIDSVYIEIHADSIAELESHPYSNDDVHGNFIAEGNRYDSIEIHYRGAFYLSTLIKQGDKRNWKVKMPSSNKYRNRKEWNFNYEPHIRQKLSYYLFEQANVPCVSTSNVNLFVNNTSYGIYLRYEDPDNKDWLLETFGSHYGDLYKAAYDMPDQQKYFADLSYLGPNNSDYFYHYRKQTNNNGAQATDYSRLIAFIKAINHTPDSEFVKTLKMYLDTDEFIRYLVVANFISNWDGYPFRPKNYFLYLNPADGQWHYIPWDLDGCFQSSGWRNSMEDTASIFHYLDGYDYYRAVDGEPLERPLVWRMMEHTEFRNDYIREYKTALTTYLSKSTMQHAIDSLETLVNAHITGEDRTSYINSITSTESFINNKYSNVKAEADLLPMPPLTEVKSYKILSDDLVVYPNPVKAGQTHLNIHVFNSNGCNVALYDLQGKLVYSNWFEKGGKERIDVYHFRKGTYFLKVNSDKGISNKKIVIL